MDKNTRYCETCAPSSNDFKKIIDLEPLGLAVYLHKETKEQSSLINLTEDDSIILHNRRNEHVQKHEYIHDLYRYRGRCNRCNKIVQRVRNLLDEVVAIKEYDTIGICEHCKKANTTNKCRRCDYVVSKFLKEHKSIIEERQKTFKAWLLKVKMLLETIQNIHYEYQHILYKDSELERILEQLKVPLSKRKPNIDYFPNAEDPTITKIISKSNEMLVDILRRIQSESADRRFTSEDSLFPSPSMHKGPCIFKSLQESLLEKELTTKVASDFQTDSMILRRLKNLEKEISVGVYKGVQENLLLAALSEAKRHGLSPDAIKRILEQLIGLQKALQSAERITSVHKTNINKLILDLLKLSKNLIHISSEETSKTSLSKDTGTDVKREILSQHSTEAGKDIKSIENSEVKTKKGKQVRATKDVIVKDDKKKPKNISDEMKAGDEKKSGETSRTTKLKAEIKVKDEKISPDAIVTKAVKDDIKSPTGKDLKVSKLNEKKETAPKRSTENLPKQGLSTLIHNMAREKPTKSKSADADKTAQLKAAKDIEEAKLKALALLKSLPEIQIKKSSSSLASSDALASVVECGSGSSGSLKYLVRGTSLKRQRKQKELHSLPTLNYKEIDLITITSCAVSMKEDEISPQEAQKSKTTDGGSIKYELSNTEFIDKGWTMLPTRKIMRRMNIYKMVPVKPKFNWFQRHRNMSKLYYDSGEILSEIDADGSGAWFYRNGSLALEYYNAQEMHVGQRFVVYSSGEEYENGYKARTILAIFDYQGNGIIYDLNGNVRLKYNQSEGIVIDPKIGPPGLWKWHTLNEPPVIEEAFVEDIERQQITDYHSTHKMEKETIASAAVSQDQMLQIELNNFARAKMKKISQKFKPFQIRMKAAKLNDSFSVRILDQSNISLMYRAGTVSFKLNLGMHLNSREIVDSQIFEIGEVVTPYDDNLAKVQCAKYLAKMV